MKKILLTAIAITNLSFLVIANEQDTAATDLRSEPLSVSEEEAPQVLDLKKDGKSLIPKTYIDNKYEDKGEVVKDNSTGLMWQKSGSASQLNYSDAQKYIEKLNNDNFAGYSNWRLPTISELISILEPDKQAYDMFFINPIFELIQQVCWSSDEVITKNAFKVFWIIHFSDGGIGVNQENFTSFVRAVRSF